MRISLEIFSLYSIKLDEVDHQENTLKMKNFNWIFFEQET